MMFTGPTLFGKSSLARSFGLAPRLIMKIGPFGFFPLFSLFSKTASASGKPIGLKAELRGFVVRPLARQVMKAVA
jgi:hypothetical protein